MVVVDRCPLLSFSVLGGGREIRVVGRSVAEGLGVKGRVTARVILCIRSSMSLAEAHSLGVGGCLMRLVVVGPG